MKVAVVFLLLFNSQLFSQVITNTGAYIKLGTGSVVVSHELENSSGTFRNEGILNLSNELRNQGSMLGNGAYNLKGDWIDFGIFNPEHSHVTMDGNVNQTIRHNGSGERFYDLTLNSPGRTFTHISLPGGTLAVGNNLSLLAGTLNLDLTTTFLTVGNMANVAGSLVYNGLTTQTASIAGPLQGAGTIDMRNGNLSHILNLAGATNSIGSFLTSAGASIVNYNGTNQTVFPAMNYRNLIISNSGIKVLQGNSMVGLDLTISGGIFDLGTVPTSFQVNGNSSVTGGFAFDGTTIKTVNLNGDLSGPGSIDMSGGNLAHVMNLNGVSNNIGTYSSGNSSTVLYIRNADQTVFPSNDYRNLTILGSGMKTLLGDVNTKGRLTMSSGSISTNSFILDLSNQAVSALAWTNGTIIGKFRRAVGTTGAEYLYPVGAATSHNPFKITFQDLTPGSVMAQFRKEDIGTVGLPLDDDGNEIYERYTYGFWTLTSSSPALSSNYSIKVDHDAFAGIDASASIIKRTDNGNLELDGTHGAVTADEVSRNILVNGISPITTDFAIGRGRPRITRQPVNIDVCEGFPAFFELRARGRGTLTYQWEVSTNGGSTFAVIVNGGVYSGATTDHLDINPAPYSMNGYLYRCIIMDAQGHFNVTTTVLLTVNKIPQATATIPAPECPGIAFDNIVLGTANDVPGTTFYWRWESSDLANTVTTLLPNGSSMDIIAGVFDNRSDAPIRITFFIKPKGPATTYCFGNEISLSFWVNPTPRLFSFPSYPPQCDSTATDILLDSPSTFTSGVVTFRYTVTTTDNVTGFTSPTTGLPDEHHIKDLLVNHTNSYQTVTYRVVPVSPVGCADGIPKQALIYVDPTPKAEPLNNIPAICYGGTTQIVLTTRTSMTSGNVVLNYTVTAGPGITGNTSPEIDRNTGYTISRSYTNDSPGLQSVYYTITPVNNSRCKAGPKVVSEVKVHAKSAQRIDETKQLQCTGGGSSFGSLKAIVSTGADPYHIEWHGPDNFHAEDIVELLNIPSGQYSLKVTDNLGCNNMLTKDFFPVYASPDLYVRPYPPGNNYGLSCIDATDGRITARVTGGLTAPYRYYLIRNNADTIGSGVFPANYDSGNPATYRIFTGLREGSYRLVTLDKNNCIANSPERKVSPPPPVNVTFGKSNFNGFNVSCRTYNNGEAWIDAISGGRGFYKYSWSTADGSITGPVTTSKIVGLTAGTYTLLVTDTLSCTTSKDVVITQPEGMNLDTAVLSKSADNAYNVSCNGGSNGSIDLTIGGGSGKYIYDWTGPGGIKYSTQDISGLKAGTYTCIITDDNNCELKNPVTGTDPSFTLTEPAPLALAYSTSHSDDGNYLINCNGGTGTININATGGSTGNYTYTWSTVNGSDIVQGQQNQAALKAGTYHVEVKDLNGCTKATDITLTEPPALNLTLSVRHITCESTGFNNGAVDLIPSGGVGQLSYQWSNGATSPDIAGLTAGTYSVNVTYNNTCVVQGSALVNNPPPLTFSSSFSNYRSYEISCFGRSDGEIHITPTSGKAPFSYYWTGPGGTYTSKDLAGLKAGTYNVQVTDSNKCVANESMVLREPGKLDVRFVLSQSLSGGYNIDCAGDSTGTITVNPQNSVNNVSYIWSDGFNGRTRVNLQAGEYSVIITDDNNCQAQGTAVLTQPDSIKLAYEIKQPFCPDMPDGEIRLTVTGGATAGDYLYKWSDKSTGRNLPGIPMGLYSVRVEDLNRCVVKDSVMVMPQNEACLIVPNMISPNGDLINDYWNIGMKELYPEIEIRIYNRWGVMVWRSAKGYPDPWDGRSDGILLPIDSYHYVIDLHNGSKPVIGNVTIVK
ncbi:MAG TPA: gliding motility-associated C-terminal domain-containing protein [Bacteroidales bacterium]|nr:gliding motility-associated C-terminal domain-containing protein [Bacteroidales bacterium]